MWEKQWESYLTVSNRLEMFLEYKNIDTYHFNSYYNLTYQRFHYEAMI